MLPSIVPKVGLELNSVWATHARFHIPMDTSMPRAVSESFCICPTASEPFAKCSASSSREVECVSSTRTLAKAAESGVITRAEVVEWLGEQAALHASGDFFQAWMFVLVTGTV
jgi:hypothetical protein